MERVKRLQLCWKLRLFFSVRVLEPGSYTGVNKENEAAGNWNLMRKSQPAGHANKVPGKVTSSSVVMNSIPRYGRSRQASMSKFLLKCMPNNCCDTENKNRTAHDIVPA
jgi:hypothetical protein